jgi:hypothetical protein
MKAVILPTVISVALCLAGCGASSTEADRYIVEGTSAEVDKYIIEGTGTETDQYIVEGTSEPYNSKGEFDEEAAREDAISNLMSSSFEDVGNTSDCTDDCSGHSAGYEWAKENAAGQSSLCSGNSNSFIEGCEAFSQAVESQVAELHEEWEAGDI